MIVTVRGGSLIGIIDEGQDLELVEEPIQRYDLVVYDDGIGKSIKRCVGIPGDTIKLIGDHIYINGIGISTTDNKSLLLENTAQMHCWNDWLKFVNDRIPQDFIFVVGNIKDCIDSRRIGFITKEQIIGRIKN